MSPRPDRTERHVALGPAWHPRPVQKVSMPRAQRPLYIGDPGFWPRPEQVSLCWWLLALNATLYAALAISILTR